MYRKIRKPWCIYKGVLFNPLGIGEIVGELGGKLLVKNSERQDIPPLTWDKEYLERFKTIKEAIEKIFEHTKYYEMERLQTIMQKNFPIAFEEEKENSV